MKNQVTSKLLFLFIYLLRLECSMMDVSKFNELIFKLIFF